MSLVAMEIPDNPADWPQWLERELVGLRLGELVSELRVIAGKQATPSPTLEEILGNEASSIREQGLSRLSRDQFALLWCHPERLLALQEFLFTEGGAYWRNLELACMADGATQRVWQGIQDHLASEQPISASDTQAAQVHSTRRTWMTAVAGGIVLLAASIFIAPWLGIFEASQEKWGWLREDTFTSQEKDDKFVTLLANRAGEWDARPRTSKAELIASLTDFRRMCDRLQQSPLDQLSNKADQDWLKERCTAWAKKIDGHLANLKEDKMSMEQVLKEANATIEGLRNALANKAKELAG